MGRLRVDGTDLVLDLTEVERLEGLHGTIRVPLSTVRDVRVAEDPWTELRGIRAPGTGVPGVIAVGTRVAKGVHDFAVVHGKGPGIVVELDGAEFDRLVVTEDDAASAAASLRQQAGLG